MVGLVMRVRWLAALPLTLLGLGMLVLSAWIGGEEYAGLLHAKMRRNLVG